MSAYRNFFQSSLKRSGSGSDAGFGAAALGPHGAPPPVPARPANSYMVVQDFIATDDDELSLSKGTAVTVTHKYDNGWWLGEYAGMQGCFPYYCVKPRGQTAQTQQQESQPPPHSSSPARPHSPAQSEAPREYALVKSDYLATDIKELSIQRGNVILLQRKTESGWWLGTIVDEQLRVTSAQGFFPSNYVVTYTPNAPSASQASAPSSPASVSRSTSLTAVPQGPWMAIAGYDATNGQELSLKPGQVLQVLAQYPNGWWIGRSNSGTGLFPGSFVKQVSPEEILLLQRRQKQQQEEAARQRQAQEEAALLQRQQAEAARQEAARQQAVQQQQQQQQQTQSVSRAVAVYAYTQQSASEMSFQVGNNITVLQKHGSGWWVGECNGARGLFPSNFVRELPTPPPVVRPSRPAAAGAPVACQAVAVGTYTAQQPGELSLQPGNVLEVLNQGQQWWLGRLNGVTGRFPGGAVRVTTVQPQRPHSPAPGQMLTSGAPLSPHTSHPSASASPRPQADQPSTSLSTPAQAAQGGSTNVPAFVMSEAPTAPSQSPATEELLNLESFSAELKQLQETAVAPAKDEEMISRLRDAVADKSSAPPPPPKSKLKSLLSSSDTLGRAASKKKNLFQEVGPFEAGILCAPVCKRAIIPNSRLATRAKVAKELYHTELSYVRCLALLRSAYELPIRQALGTKAVLKAADADAIFSNAQEILVANLKLLYLLEEVINRHEANMSLACVGSLFPGLKPEFSAYARYAIGYSGAVELLMAQLKKNGRFKRFLADTAARNSQCTGQSLQSFLIMPVQRTPRYVLLLAEMLKCTPPEHSDYRPLLEAKTAMEDVAMFINEEKRNAELKGELDELLARLDPLQQDLSSSDLLKHGPVALRMSGGSPRKRYLLLFRQALLVTKKQSDFFGSGVSYVVVQRWPLSKCKWRGESEDSQGMVLGTPQGECCVQAEDAGQLSSMLEWKSAFETARLALVR